MHRTWPTALTQGHMGRKITVYVKDGAAYVGTLKEVEFDKLILVDTTRNTLPCNGMVSILFEKITHIPDVDVDKCTNKNDAETSAMLTSNWILHTASASLPNSKASDCDEASPSTTASTSRQTKAAEVEKVGDKAPQKNEMEFVHPPWLAGELKKRPNSIFDIRQTADIHDVEYEFNYQNTHKTERVKNWIHNVQQRSNDNQNDNSNAQTNNVQQSKKSETNTNKKTKENYGRKHNGNASSKKMSTSHKTAATKCREESTESMSSLSDYDSDVTETSENFSESFIMQSESDNYDSECSTTVDENSIWEDCDECPEMYVRQYPEGLQEEPYQYSNRNCSNVAQTQQTNKDYNQQVNLRKLSHNNSNRNGPQRPAPQQNKTSLVSKPIGSIVANGNNKTLPRVAPGQRAYAENKIMPNSTGVISKPSTFQPGNRRYLRSTQSGDNGVSSMTSKCNKQHKQINPSRGGPYFPKYLQNSMSHSQTVSAQNVVSNNIQDGPNYFEHFQIIYKTFNGCVVPSVSVDIREKIRLTAARSGLVVKETNAFLGRGICDLAMSLLKHVCNVSEEDENCDTNVDVVIICEGAIEVGLMTGLLLSGHCFSVCLYTQEKISSGFNVNSSIERQSSIEYFRKTGNTVVGSVNKLLTPNLIILCTNVVSDVMLPDDIINWIYSAQRDVLVVDPPPNFQLEKLNAQKFAAMPILPLDSIEERYSQLYLINLFIPFVFFAEEGIEFENPFGMKSIVRLYPKIV